MEYLLDNSKQIRKILLKILDETPKDLLLEIPKNFNNNIWWNIAHVVVTQQLLVYKFSGMPMLVSDEMVEKYKKGTFPDGTATDEEITQIKELLFSTLKQTDLDYNAGNFKSYTPYTTSLNITLSNAVEAMKFNALHEGIHIGSILALKRNIGK
ncbi:DinB family protein [Cellulophaga omnivescoria]|uniref:DinB family protein n=1 Tax=Cellulophaga omnivescoria TaxID=1888890 RepID=UPI0022EFF34A|nr:DinB family protein [Cellulophaga omnivescoria]WBU90418.1 DinB family protein [Cellulophaga omnivescoria]